MGKVTAAIGCNLDAPGARAMIAKVLPHVNFDQLYNGKIALSDSEIETLFQHQLDVAVADATHLVPSFDAQPDGVQLALTDMSFEMGLPKLAGFKRFLAAINSEHYAEAIAQITNSVYFHEVPSRARDIIALISTAANHRSFEEAKSVPPSKKSISPSS
jgi:hypothetical protein